MKKLGDRVMEDNKAEPTGTITEAPPVPPASEDLAASFFRLEQPRLKILLSKLTSKQLRRVIFNASSYPFVDKAYNPRTDTERQAAYLVSEMVTNKMIMQLSFEMQQAEKAMADKNNSEGDENGKV